MSGATISATASTARTLCGIFRQPRMNWTDLKDTIYIWDGSWRDVYVLNATKDDWKKWINYVNQNYKIDWFNGKTEQDENKIDFAVIEEFWSGNENLTSTAIIHIAGIQINAHFFSEHEIENDIDPREFNSIEDHEKLIKYMTDLSTLLGKKVILTPENVHEMALMEVTKETVKYSTDINPSKWELRLR